MKKKKTREEWLTMPKANSDKIKRITVKLFIFIES